MTPAGRLRSLARTGLLALAVLAAVFGPAVADAATHDDPSALTAAVLPPTDGASFAWRHAPAPRHAGDLVVPLVVLVALVPVRTPAAGRRAGHAIDRAALPAVPWGRPPPGRAPPLLVVV